ncbi:DUF2304 domain-containing protein [bacterium]|nr:DUF2304 domain-containing protein [bacterium]
MQTRIMVTALGLGLILLAVIFQLIRKNRLQEKYSILWIASAVVMVVLSVWTQLLKSFSAWIGIFYPPSALFAVAVFCGLVIALHYSVVLSTLTSQNKTLAQELALLREEVARLRLERSGGGKRPAVRRGARR